MTCLHHGFICPPCRSRGGFGALCGGLPGLPFCKARASRTACRGDGGFRPAYPAGVCAGCHETEQRVWRNGAVFQGGRDRGKDGAGPDEWIAWWVIFTGRAGERGRPSGRQQLIKCSAPLSQGPCSALQPCDLPATGRCGGRSKASLFRLRPARGEGRGERGEGRRFSAWGLGAVDEEALKPRRPGLPERTQELNQAGDEATARPCGLARASPPLQPSARAPHDPHQRRQRLAVPSVQQQRRRKAAEAGAQGGPGLADAVQAGAALGFGG